MTEVLPKTIVALAGGRPSLEDAVESLVAEWSPDPVPITVAMSELGRAMIESAEQLGHAEIRRILANVEQLLETGGEAEKDAAATGFLEAVAAAVDTDPSKRWVLAMAGQRARAYLKAWDEFCGVE